MVDRGDLRGNAFCEYAAHVPSSTTKSTAARLYTDDERPLTDDDDDSHDRFRRRSASLNQLHLRLQ